MEDFYNKARWRKKRETILRRDNYKCKLCGRYGRNVNADHVHHIYPVEFYPEYAYENWNLISLCKVCHNRMHERDTHQLTAEGEALKRKVEQWTKSRHITADFPRNRGGSTADIMEMMKG